MIGDVLGPSVVLVSSAEETAFEVRRLLAGDRRALARAPGRGPGRHRFVSSGDVSWFRDLGSRLLGPELAAAEAHRWPPEGGPEVGIA